MSGVRAGVSKVKLTPPVGTHMAGFVFRLGKSEGVHDELYAKALVLDDGKKALAIAALDIIGTTKDTVKRVKEIVSTETGIKGTNIILSSSHTHGGPNTIVNIVSQGFGWPVDEAYNRILPEYIAGAITSAWRMRAKAKIGFGMGRIEGVSVNRRYAGGPIDPEVGVLRVNDKGGKMMACMVNFACHPIGLGGQNLLFTADYPAYLSGLIEMTKGGVSLFVNGAAGDINPWDWYWVNRKPRLPQDFEAAERLGNAIGGEAMKVLELVETHDDPKIAVKQEDMKLELRKPPPVGEMRKILQDALKQGKRWSKDKWDDDVHVCTLRERYAKEYEIYFAEQVYNIAKQEIRELKTEVVAARVDDFALATAPGELFVELGLDLKKKSKFKNTTIVAGYSNDIIGYIPTKKAVKESGLLWHDAPAGISYGTTLPSTVLDEDGGEKIKETALSLIEEL